MNAVKRIARKRHYRKTLGPGAEVFADNRNFRSRDESGEIGRLRHADILGKTDHQQRKLYEEGIQFIEAHRDSIDLNLPHGGTYVGFHGNLREKTRGEIAALYGLMRKVVSIQKPAV